MAAPRNPGSSSSRSGGVRPNTLGLGQRELGELLDLFESPESHGGAPKRDYVRSPFRQASVRIEIFHPGGVTATIMVACRNLSRGGMGILHSSYLHTGTKCRVYIPHPTKGEIAVNGWMARCVHRSGVVHEIGIRFDQQLDIQEVLRPNPFADCFSLERVNPENLSGHVVCVDDSEIDRKIVKHFLRGTKMQITLATSGQEALGAIDETVDLVLCDYHLGDMTGAEVQTKLRESGIQVPVIIMTCDPQTVTTAMAGSRRADAFLAKPLTQELLLRAVAEFLVVRKAETAVRNSSGGDAANMQLTDGLITALGQYAKKLEDAIQRQDAATARTICLQVAGAAGTIGFADIRQLATKASEAVSRSMSTTDSVSPLRSLVAACQKAKGRGKSAA